MQLQCEFAQIMELKSLNLQEVYRLLHKTFQYAFIKITQIYAAICPSSNKSFIDFYCHTDSFLLSSFSLLISLRFSQSMSANEIDLQKNCCTTALMTKLCSLPLCVPACLRTLNDCVSRAKLPWDGLESETTRLQQKL